jgi:hypothetical protein
MYVRSPAPDTLSRYYGFGANNMKPTPPYNLNPARSLHCVVVLAFQPAVARTQSFNIVGPYDQPLYHGVQYLLVSDFTTFCQLLRHTCPFAHIRYVANIPRGWVLAQTQDGDERCHSLKFCRQHASQSTKQAGASCPHHAGPEGSATAGPQSSQTTVSNHFYRDAEATSVQQSVITLGHVRHRM